MGPKGVKAGTDMRTQCVPLADDLATASSGPLIVNAGG